MSLSCDDLGNNLLTIRLPDHLLFAIENLIQASGESENEIIIKQLTKAISLQKKEKSLDFIEFNFLETVFLRIQDILYEWRDGQGNFFDQYYDTNLMCPSYRPWEQNNEQIINDIALLRFFSENNNLNELDYHYFQFVIYYLTALTYYQILGK